MDSTDDELPVSVPAGQDCGCVECREGRLKWAPGATTPESELQPPPLKFYGSADDEVVGLNDETRAEARKLILKTLTDFTREVRTAQDEGEIDSLKAFRLRLQIHRERCALLGLGYANGVTW